MKNRYTMRAALTIVGALFAAATLAAQTADVAGRWDGKITIPGQTLVVAVNLEITGGLLSGTIDIPAQGAKGLPLTKLSAIGNDVGFTIGGIPGEPTFKGTLSTDRSTISGTFTQGDVDFPFTLNRKSEAEKKAATDSMAADLDSLRAIIPKALEKFRVPGAAVVVMREGEVIFSEGFGYRDLELKQPVTPSTLFAIGSSTKAFTATVISSLVDEGKLEWDESVATYLTDFRLKSDYATGHMTVRDLLTHVSGLPRHDLLWYGSMLTRREIFERLRYLEPTAELHEQWQYQNMMYMTAGLLAEQVTGKSWETLVRERIFEPLGMSASNFSVIELATAADRSLPYQDSAKTILSMPYRSLDQIGPAGSINSSVVDMARWLELQLGKGKVDEKQILPERVVTSAHRPRVVMSGVGADDDLLFNLYGMGWMVHAYRGTLLVEHGGNIDGFSALVSFLPRKNLGIVVLTNMNATPLPTALAFTAYDLLLDFERRDWIEEMSGSGENLDSLAEAMEKNAELTQVKGTKPSHPLKDYAGSYENPGYGTIEVSVEGNRLRAGYNGEVSELEHFHYDIFRVKEAAAGDMKVQFRMGLTGDIEEVLVPLEPAVDPLVFTRSASKALSDSVYLRQFVGEYELAGVTFTVTLDRSRLKMSVPGQPTYTLQPKREMEFDLEGLSGYTARFEGEKGKIVRMMLIQPNGNFVATRK